MVAAARRRRAAPSFWRQRSRRLRSARRAGGGAGARQPASGSAAGHLPDRAGQARSGAAQFIEAADKYPSHDGRHRGAIPRRIDPRRPWAATAKPSSVFRKSCRAAGSTLYAQTGRLGLAEAQVAQKKYDSAITIYTEMCRDTSSHMPVDGILMQLGRACALAGRKEEAVARLHARDREFPTSMYIEPTRERELEGVRKS